MCAEELKDLLLLRHLKCIRRLAERDELLAVGETTEVRMLRKDTCCKVGDVGAVVAVFGHRATLRHGHDGGPEAIHLHTAVIDVELRGDLGPRGSKHTRQRIAHRGPARVSEVERSRRVGGDEFDIEAAPREETAVPVAGARLHNLPRHHALGIGRETDIDEARSRYLGLGDPLHGREARGHQVGDLTGRPARRLGEREGHRGGVITMIAVLGSLDDHLVGYLPRQGSLSLERQHALAHGDGQVLGSHDRSVIARGPIRL